MVKLHEKLQKIKKWLTNGKTGIRPMFFHKAHLETSGLQDVTQEVPQMSDVPHVVPCHLHPDGETVSTATDVTRGSTLKQSSEINDPWNP